MRLAFKVHVAFPHLERRHHGKHPRHILRSSPAGLFLRPAAQERRHAALCWALEKTHAAWPAKFVRAAAGKIAFANAV